MSRVFSTSVSGLQYVGNNQNFPYQTYPFTFSLWYKIPSIQKPTLNTYSRLMMVHKPAGLLDSGWSIGIGYNTNSGGQGTGVYLAARAELSNGTSVVRGSAFVYYDGLAGIPENTWALVVAQFTNATHRFIRVNNTYSSINTTNVSDTALTGNSSIFIPYNDTTGYVGGSSADIANNCPIYIAEPAIWKRALTNTECDLLLTAPPTIIPQSLVFYLPFDTTSLTSTTGNYIFNDQFNGLPSSEYTTDHPNIYTAFSSANTSTTIENFLTSYNHITRGMNKDVFRLNYSPSVGGKLTLNGIMSAQSVSIANTSLLNVVDTNIQYRLEQRNNVLHFNNQRVSIFSPVVYGYVAGGLNATAAYATSSERFTFSTATSATQTPVLSSGRAYIAGLSDTKIYGYVGGGRTSGSISVVTSDRVTFSTSTIAAHTPSNASTATDRYVSISDGALYGYYLGGLTGTTVVTRQDRLTFATASLSAYTPGNLTTSRYAHMGLSDAVTYGYVFGGFTVASTGYVNTVERITFSTSLASASTATISQARSHGAAVSDGAIYGYVSGGFSGATNYATTDRVTFSSGAIAAHTPANLSTVRYELASISDTDIYGYYLGGTTNAIQQTADRVTFSTSITAAYTPGNLVIARRQHAALTDATV